MIIGTWLWIAGCEASSLSLTHTRTFGGSMRGELLIGGINLYHPERDLALGRRRQEKKVMMSDLGTWLWMFSA